jgi:hypothetical protein
MDIEPLDSTFSCPIEQIHFKGYETINKIYNVFKIQTPLPKQKILSMKLNDRVFNESDETKDINLSRFISSKKHINFNSSQLYSINSNSSESPVNNKNSDLVRLKNDLNAKKNNGNYNKTKNNKNDLYLNLNDIIIESDNNEDESPNIEKSLNKENFEDNFNLFSCTFEVNEYSNQNSDFMLLPSDSNLVMDNDN